MRGVYYLCAVKTKINTPLMYEVLDKDTIKSESLPHLSVAKRGYVTKVTLWRSFSAFSTSWKRAVSGTCFPFQPSSRGGFWATRACMPISASGRGTANGKRFGAWCWTVTGLSWTCPVWIWTAATPPRFAVGSAVDTKDARKERPPMPSMSQTGKAYRLPCPRLFRVLTTTFTTSPRYFRTCSRILRTQACPYRGSFSMQMPALTLHYSGEVAISRRCSQTSPSISVEECGEMTSYLMSCFTRRDTALKGPMRGWTHTGAYSTGSIPHKPVGRDGTISHLYWFFQRR